MRRLRMLSTVVLGSLLLQPGGAGTAAAADPPVSMAGEFFTNASFLFPGGPASCAPAGESTGTFTASGTANGPYPGTFTATVTVTIGPQVQANPAVFDLAAGPVTRFDVTFAIDSPAGQVAGTQSIDTTAPMDPASPAQQGVCDAIPPGSAATFPGLPLTSVGSGTAFDAQYNYLRYEAAITTEAGRFADSGLSSASFLFAEFTDGVRPDGTAIGSAGLSGFGDFFLTSTGVVPVAVSTPGEATGGGRVPSSTGPVSFGVNARNINGRLTGRCTLVNPGRTVAVKCLDVTGFVRSGTHVTVSGNAEVNGTPATYRIDADDLGEPGTGRDRFSIATSAGYAAGGVLEAGNVQVAQ